MSDWETWGGMRESFMSGVCEPLYNVGEWVYVWYGREWHYATITRYMPSDRAQLKDNGAWSIDYVFAEFSHGEFDGTVLLDDAFDTVRRGPKFRVSDRIDVRSKQGSQPQWFEATVTGYVPKGHAETPWRVEFRHDEGGAVQVSLKRLLTHQAPACFTDLLKQSLLPCSRCCWTTPRRRCDAHSTAAATG